jgi:DNA-binding response OmpR family regulator
MRILLVEDHERLSGLVQQGLKKAELDCDSVARASEARQALACHHYDAMILDIGLPDEDGLSLLAGLRREENHMPVLILTSRVQVADRVKGLDAGADDYLTKPFAMEELIARVHALLRRPQAALGQVLSVGDVTFDVGAREARVAGAPVKVSRQESRVLEVLLRRNGRVVPKGMIEQGLYGLGDNLSSNSVEVIVHRLRKKLQDKGAATKIHTVHGVGYMILAEEPPEDELANRA